MKAAGDAQTGQDGCEDGYEQLQNEFPSFLVHGIFKRLKVSG